MKIQSKSSGFSLIEILVAISIIITATTVVVAILSSSFRGINKSNVSEEVRQNGNSAIGRMTRIIQYAESFQGAKINNGDTYDTPCVTDKPYQYISLRSGGRLTTLSCGNLSVDSTPLIDITKVKVDAGTCSFSCTQEDSTDSPIIGINFRLSQKNATVPEKSASILFSTTVKMRNR